MLWDSFLDYDYDYEYEHEHEHEDELEHEYPLASTRRAIGLENFPHL